VLSRLRSALVAIVFSAVLVLAPAAFAQPVQWESVTVTAQGEGSRNVLLVKGTLPEGAKLPAQVEIPVPAGAELQWSGEILGGPLAEDPAVEATKVTKGGVDVYSFTLTKARQGQVEVLVPPFVRPDGDNYAATVAWVATQPVGAVELNVGLPKGAQVVSPVEGAVIQPVEGGRSYYVKTFEDVAAGEPIGLDFAYSAPVVTAAAQGAQSRSNVVPFILVAVALLAAVALYRGVSRKLAAKSALAVDDDGDPDSGSAGARALDGAGVASNEGDSDDPDTDPASRRMRPTTVATIAIVALVVATIAAVSYGSGAKVADGKISRSFGGEAQACTSASIPLVVNEGVNLSRSGEKLVDSLAGIPGIGQATLYVDEGRIEVKFCDSTSSEDAIRGALGSTGLVTF